MIFIDGFIIFTAIFFNKLIVGPSLVISKTNVSSVPVARHLWLKSLFAILVQHLRNAWFDIVPRTFFKPWSLFLQLYHFLHGKYVFVDFELRTNIRYHQLELLIPIWKEPLVKFNLLVNKLVFLIEIFLFFQLWEQLPSIVAESVLLMSAWAIFKIRYKLII